MSESPPHGGGPPKAPEGGEAPKAGASDPLFHPPGLRMRQTVMGLAPAPHLGGANKDPLTEAEARKQRVLARIAAMDSKPPPGAETGPPPRAVTGPPPRATSSGSIEPLPPPYSVAPPPNDVKPAAPLRQGHAAGDDAPQKQIIEETYIGLPANVPGARSLTGEPRRPTSSDRRLPAASGWDVHDVADAEIVRTESTPASPAVTTEVMEAAPNTARMHQAAAAQPAVTAPPAQPAVTAPPAQPVVTAPVVTLQPAAQRASVYPVPATSATPSSPPPAAEGAPGAALALRPHDPYPLHALPGPHDGRLVMINEPNSDRATSYRILRDALVAKSMPRVLAVSSGAPNEGKTTCAVNLALALAEQSSTRVLLVDANYFDPALAKIFALDRFPSSVPAESVSWLAPYKLVEVSPQLHVAGIVHPPGAPQVRFEQQRFEALIDRLVRVSYDYILIDTPALRGTPFVSQLVSIADATLLAVRAGGSTARDVRRAAEQIPGKKAIGIALIDAP
ncbi:MAG: hypothetical protein KIS78_07645 [Labilithrix sp.]|nr:hypothetical protein [Labilithrix sp.]